MNNNHNSCEFCNEFSGGNSNSFRTFIDEDELCSRTIIESEGFRILPGLGALIEGYLLIIPEIHCLSLGHLPSSEYFQQLEKLVDTVRAICEDYYDLPYIFFEHGACASGNTAGSSVEHAHLHAMPFSQKLRGLLARRFQEQQFLRLDYLEEIAQSGQPYLFLENQDGLRFVYYVSSHLPSQYMRRIWAASMDKPEKWDWALHVGKQKIIQTYFELKKEFDKRYIVDSTDCR